MDRNLKWVFIDEILFRRDMAHLALKRLRKISSANENVWPSREDVDIGFESIYAFLHHVSGIALVLFPWTGGKDSPVRADRLSRGKYLRELIGVADDHILSDKRLRNHIAHMDERIDTWYKSSTNQNISRLVWENRSGIGNFAVSDQFEHYLPNEDVMIFRGEEYRIGAIWDAVVATGELAYPHSAMAYREARLKELDSHDDLGGV